MTINRLADVCITAAGPACVAWELVNGRNDFDFGKEFLQYFSIPVFQSRSIVLIATHFTSFIYFPMYLNSGYFQSSAKEVIWTVKNVEDTHSAGNNNNLFVSKGCPLALNWNGNIAITIIYLLCMYIHMWID